ncbi:MAG: metallophosphoesterase [Planctomycetes bacterium]|nr:metallophosphoesterase [Planctomycetota bacterium]
MFAVLSDIHGNLEALDAVRADLARRPVSAVYCLGDLVGYGPNPVECIEAAREWDVVLIGNHDQAVLFDPDGFGQSAERAIFWTRRVLETSGRSDLWSYLAERPRTHREDDFLFVHGSARSPTNEYVFPEDIYNQRKMDRIGELIERYCFCGHTHVPGVFVRPDAEGEPWEFHTPEERHHFWRFDGRKTIVNVGSVGQPRDGDRRACYVTVDGWDVHFHRVEYDWRTTRDKIYAIPDLDNFLGDRLEEGR